MTAFDKEIEELKKKSAQLELDSYKAKLEEKLKELKMELIRANVAANKTGKIKIKAIRRTIAKLLTFTAKKPEKQ